MAFLNSVKDRILRLMDFVTSFLVNNFRSWLSLWQEEETILFCAILLLKPFTSKM
jgi:hypothetical protein